jgi:hypothetical protein
MMGFDLGDSLFGCQEEDWEKEGDIRSCHEMGPVALAEAAFNSASIYQQQMTGLTYQSERG